MTRSLLILLAGSSLIANAESNWPQFRGPGGLGIGTGSPPIEFGADKNLLWKTDIPHGHSSPCIWGDKLILTGSSEGKLVTFCLSRKDGHELWRVVAPAEKLEPTHRIGSPASTTACTDGTRIIVYFGSFGVLCYDLDGKELWRKPMPVPVVEFGTGASPVLADGKVFIANDQDVGSCLLALDAATGREVWRTERPEFRRSFSTPFVWKHGDEQELVVAGSLWVRSYDLKDGHERWSAHGMARVSNASPTAGDGMLIVSSWNVGGDDGDRVIMVPFEEFAAANDKNKDGVLTIDEFPKGPIKDRFSQIDVDKDAKVTRDEYDHMKAMFADAKNQLFAIKPGGHGDITDTNLMWSIGKHLPYVSSPLCVNNRVYAIKNGGLASCYDAHSGSTLYQAERMDAPGDYYSSAITADGRVYVASQKGTVSVLDENGAFKILARNVIGEPIFATPAIVDGRLYLRTDKHLFAFGE
jgi:outer membrane protein assembly factor BamB